MKKESRKSLLLSIITAWVLMGIINFVAWKLGDEHPIKDWICYSVLANILSVYYYHLSTRSNGEKQEDRQ